MSTLCSSLHWFQAFLLTEASDTQTCWQVAPDSSQTDTASAGCVLHLTCHGCQVLVRFLVCQTITQTHTPNKTKKTRYSQILRPLKIILMTCLVSFLDLVGLASDKSNASRRLMLSFGLWRSFVSLRKLLK